jgi:hypothetical protein
MAIQRLILCFAAGAAAAAWGGAAVAQEPACRYYKVQANSLNINKEARNDSIMIDMLDKGEIVCVTREQKVADRDWVFVAHKLPKPNVRTMVDGWGNLRQLQPLTPAEIAAVTKAPPPVPAVPAAEAAVPTDEVVRYTQPVQFGPHPVNGHSIEQLILGVPLFSPIEGLEESLWKKPCSACHKWDRQTLCEQGVSYAKNPRTALRHPHPMAGFKSALMIWAKTGCQ